MFHSFYLFHLYVYMKMVEIPSLYELACRAYSGTWMPGYQEAFDKAMSEEEKPCLILMRIESRYPEISFGDEKIKNVFSWRIAYMDEERFGTFGPLQGRYGHISQVAVIEDVWEDGWGNELEVPEMYACRYHTLYGWDKDPSDESQDDFTYKETHWARSLRAEEIVREFEKVDFPAYQHEPLEGKWFEDAEFPLHLIDGVPESYDHSEIRNRINVNGTYHRLGHYMRDYLQDPDWRSAFKEELRRQRAELMEE